MTDWLAPLRSACDARDERLRWFVRDDDVGWADDDLSRLLEVCDAASVVPDLAVIPAALSPRLERRLVANLAEGRVRVHQHGWRHANHEQSGRKSEFGTARTPAQVMHDVRRGFERIGQTFGSSADRVFTPPWNRCSRWAANALVDLGVAVLSRDITAEPFANPSLDEVPVTFDWTKHWRAASNLAEFGETLGAAVRRSVHLGVMLHHAETSDVELEVLRCVFDGLRDAGAIPTTILGAARQATS